MHAHDRYVWPAAAAASHWYDKLTFRWEITIDDESHESEVSVRADNAAERGVPFPATWTTELNLGAVQPVVSVDALARSAVQRACEERPLPEDENLHRRRQRCITESI